MRTFHAKRLHRTKHPAKCTACLLQAKDPLIRRFQQSVNFRNLEHH